MQDDAPVVPMIVAISQERLANRWQRIGIIGLSTAALLVLAALTIHDESLFVAALTVCGFSWSYLRNLGRRRMLVLRADDVFTIGGEIDSAVAWSELDGIEAAGSGVDLMRRDGTCVHLRLGFIATSQRIAMIEMMIRYLEVFRLHGPLRLPEDNRAEIRSDRLVLRPRDGRDAEFLVTLMMAENRYDNQLSVRTGRTLVEQSIRENHRVAGWGHGWFREYVIEKDGIPIGTVSAHMRDTVLRRAELGIELLLAYRSQGLGSEALAALIADLTARTNILKVGAGCFADNIGSRRALEKAGMVCWGTTSRFWLKGSEWKDGAFFERLLR